MKVTLTRKTALIAFAVLVILSLLSASGYILYNRLNGCTLSDGLQASYIHPNSQRLSSVDGIWELHIIQPEVLDYKTVDGINYLIGAIEGQNGECVKLNLILSGNIAVKDSTGELNDYKLINVGSEKISYENFMTRYPEGSQVNAYFLGKKPTDDIVDDDFCAQNAGLQLYCDIHRINLEFTSGIVEVPTVKGAYKNTTGIFLPLLGEKVINVADLTD